MPFVSIPKDEWTVITTTTEDTLVQNRGARTLYITTEDTTSLPLNEGAAIAPGQAVVVSAGKDVEACFMDSDGEVFYMGV